MNKVIAILSEDELMRDGIKTLNTHKAMTEVRKKFIMKQIKDVEDSVRAAEATLSKMIMDRLGLLGRIPKEYKTADNLIIDIDRDCVLWHSCDQDCGHGSLQVLLQTNPPPPGDGA